MTMTKTRVLTVCAAVLLVLGLAACQADVHNALNADRVENGKPALPRHTQLDTKAQAWAEHLADEEQLEHSNISAGVPSCWSKLGENVGRGPSVQAVEDAYMASSTHRANVLGTWKWVGVGFATGDDGLVYTVQVFMAGC